MKTIGILGGFGPDATIELERRILEESRRRIPPALNGGYPPVVTFHLRHPPVRHEHGAPPAGPLRIDDRVLEAARRLGALADLLIIGANAPHLFADEIAAAAGCEVVSMVDVVVEEIRRRPVAPVGLLGLGVPEAYVKRLDREGIATVVADPQARRDLDEGILRTLEGRTTDTHREAAREAVRSVRARGAQATVLGCTEIPILLATGAVAPDLIDPGPLVVRAAVARAIDESTA